MVDYSGQAHFNNYDPSSFGWPHAVPNLVPLTFKGVNFGQCAADAHPVLVAVLTELVPYIKGGLVPGKCWAYSTTDDLPDGSWSFHRYGLAMDINWNVNHMGNNIHDAEGMYAIPRDKASSIARKYGCEWGGNWTGGFHDNMHIEVHLSPGDARGVCASVAARVRSKLTGNTAWPYKWIGNYFGVHMDSNPRAHDGRYGFEGDWVQAIQMRLQDKGFAPKTPGWADKKFGQPTQDAVKKWQKATGRKVTGGIDKSGWKALNS